MGTKTKKKILPDYLKNSLKGIIVGGTAGIDDDEFVTVPRGSLSITKGKTTVEGGVAKPISKFDKENINSDISLSISRGDEKGGYSLTGTKSGKRKTAEFSFSKKFTTGGEARGTGAAIRGKGFKGVF